MDPITVPVPVGGGDNPLGEIGFLIVLPIIAGALLSIVGYVAGFLLDALIGGGGRSLRDEKDAEWLAITTAIIGAWMYGWPGGLGGLFGGAVVFGFLGDRAGARTWARRGQRLAFGLGLLAGAGVSIWVIAR
ncbi:MAG TPA: hypothetical protein VL463_17190 [Kofleriaceae bacterium]|nr:hypothetical protein [Kofleriaceae bacterium]